MKPDPVHLLDQVAIGLSGNLDHSALLSLGLACHRRMLELGDSDKPEAIRHAIAGAHVFRVLKQHNDPQPDWLGPHEEQCCRYGAIWIADLLWAGHPDGGQWKATAVELLNRMEDYYESPPQWGETIRQELIAARKDHIAQQPSQAAIKIVVVGNCQCHPLFIGLERILPQADIHFCPSVHLASPDDVLNLHTRLNDADLLITHRIQPGYRNNIGLDTPSLQQLLPEGSRILVLPNMHYEGLHPFIGYAQDPDGRLQDQQLESPLGPYHDFLAMAGADAGISAAELLSTPPVWILDQLRKVHAQSIQSLQERESDCDVIISDWIEQHHKTRPLMHSINHPTQQSIDQLLRRLLAHIDASIQPSEPIVDAHEHLGNISIPIHPWVITALDLGEWAASWGKRADRNFSIEQQLQESICFYQQHPWIIAANQTQPKLETARTLLHEISASNLASSTAKPRQPSVAALINYYNDEEMLAWQFKSGCLDSYDRIYIWDGPYAYASRIAFGQEQPTLLEQGAFGQQLIADSRVVYCKGTWADEAAKRCNAYAAISEDIIVLHDTDEFFQLNHDQLKVFWDSSYSVAAQQVQNLYAGGLLGSDSHHRSTELKDLPFKRVIFKRSSISAERHLDYCWLVGVQQQPTDESLVQPEPLGHTYHLTACRSRRGQMAKMSFYSSLSLSKNPNNPIVNRLRELVENNELTREESVLIYLRGDPGYAGIPNPEFGLSLQPRINDPTFPADILQTILNESNRLECGKFKVLAGHPLYLWIPGDKPSRELQISLKNPLSMVVRCWLWLNQQPAIETASYQSHGHSVQLSLPTDALVMGHLLQIIVQPSQAEQLQLYDLAIHEN